MALSHGAVAVGELQTAKKQDMHIPEHVESARSVAEMGLVRTMERHEGASPAMETLRKVGGDKITWTRSFDSARGEHNMMVLASCGEVVDDDAAGEVLCIHSGKIDDSKARQARTLRLSRVAQISHILSKG